MTGNLFQKNKMFGICIDCKQEKELQKRSSKSIRYYSWCTDCNRERNKKYYEANKERAKINGKRWLEKNREKVNAVSRQSYAKHKDRHMKNVYDWRKRNKEEYQAYVNFRRRRLREATPPWADLEEIKNVYLEAQYFGMHVDHIIPLQGKNVCGLHVWDNLQLLSAVENIKKGNRYAVHQDG